MECVTATTLEAMADLLVRLLPSLQVPITKTLVSDSGRKMHVRQMVCSTGGTIATEY